MSSKKQKRGTPKGAVPQGKARRTGAPSVPQPTRGAGGAATPAQIRVAQGDPNAGGRPMPRLKQRYREEVLGELRDQLGLGNPMEVPEVEKIVVNMGVGEAIRDAKLLDAAVADLMTVTGQRPAIRRARKSIAAFKLREGMAIGAMVTLRGDRMWEFLDRLLSTALPRIRDFRGLNPDSFDGRGNYSLGVTEQLIFPEIDYDKVVRVRGMDITIVTTARDDDTGRALLRALGFPFAGQPAVAAAAAG